MHSASTSTLQNDTHVDAGTRAVLDTSDVYLKTNPWKSSGAAASAGVLVGLLLARR